MWSISRMQRPSKIALTIPSSICSSGNGFIWLPVAFWLHKNVEHLALCCELSQPIDIAADYSMVRPNAILLQQQWLTEHFTKYSKNCQHNNFPLGIPVDDRPPGRSPITACLTRPAYPVCFPSRLTPLIWDLD